MFLVETVNEHFFGTRDFQPNRVANPALEMQLMCKPCGDKLRRQCPVILLRLTQTNTSKNTSLLRHFYDNLQSVVEAYELTPDRIYNTDETYIGEAI